MDVAFFSKLLENLSGFRSVNATRIPPGPFYCFLMSFPPISFIPGLRDQACDAYIKRVVALPGEIVSVNKKGEVKFLSNNAGGILGGISSGQNIVCSIAVKPTSSILKTQKTVNTKNKNTTIRTKGRHDPCVGIRCVPIAEAMVALVLADHLLRRKTQS